jgi:hypothetical protein
VHAAEGNLAVHCETLLVQLRIYRLTSNLIKKAFPDVEIA